MEGTAGTAAQQVKVHVVSRTYPFHGFSLAALMRTTATVRTQTTAYAFKSLPGVPLSTHTPHPPHSLLFLGSC